MLISDDLNTVAKGIDAFITTNPNKKHKEFAKIADRYYDGDHDILDTRIFFINDKDELVEDKYASNLKLPHPFFMELIDQKVQYLLSENIEFQTENTDLEKALHDYINEDFQLFLDEIVEGASVKGDEYAYARVNHENILSFQVSDTLLTDTIYDDYNNEVAIMRRYTKEINKEGKDVIQTYAEVYSEKDVKFFIQEEKEQKFEPDKSVEFNPRAHVIAVSDDGLIATRNYGQIPFYRLKNNRKALSDLKPIKPLIDDYDLMSSFLSNNLQDYDKPIFVVSGFKGQSLDQLKQNIKSRGMVDVGSPNSGGDVDLKTYQIPYEGRKAKMEMDKESIYKFGMGFDSSQVGDGNITNVVIRSRYTLLDMKCNKIESRLRSMIKWCLELILQDLEIRGKGTFDINDIEIAINRSTPVNEKDNADVALVEAQTKETLINSLVLANPYISDSDITEKICEYFDLDLDEVKARIEEDDGYLDDSIDEEVDADGQEAEQVAE